MTILEMLLITLALWLLVQVKLPLWLIIDKKTAWNISGLIAVILLWGIYLFITL